MSSLQSHANPRACHHSVCALFGRSHLRLGVQVVGIGKSAGAEIRRCGLSIDEFRPNQSLSYFGSIYVFVKLP